MFLKFPVIRLDDNLRSGHEVPILRGIKNHFVNTTYMSRNNLREHYFNLLIMCIQLYTHFDPKSFSRDPFFHQMHENEISLQLH